MKYRKILLSNDILNFLENICFEIGEIYYFEFDAVGCDGDHVHLFVGSEPKYSPSGVPLQKIRTLRKDVIFTKKTIKSKVFSREHPDLCSYSK